MSTYYFSHIFKYFINSLLCVSCFFISSIFFSSCPSYLRKLCFQLNTRTSIYIEINIQLKITIIFCKVCYFYITVYCIYIIFQECTAQTTIQNQKQDSKIHVFQLENKTNLNKSSIPHKTKSATELSKEIKPSSFEVASQVVSPLECRFNTRCISQQPVCGNSRKLPSPSHNKNQMKPRKRKIKRNRNSFQSQSLSSHSR